MAQANTSKKLLQALTSPSKLASRFDWRKVNGGSVLSLNIHKDRIGLALAAHPSYGNGPYTLESIPLARKTKVTEESKKALANIIEEHNVCGFVVSWPLQPDSQRMGAACGRVLHTLEQLLQPSKDAAEEFKTNTKSKAKTNTPLISANRPCVLWKDSQSKTIEEPDVFGRLEAFAKVPSSDKTVHIASIEQYNPDDATVASQVWSDFMRVHWPDLHREQEHQELVACHHQQMKNTLLTQTSASAVIAAVAVKGGRSSHDVEDDASYMQAAI
ncbi:unnamed protein product [Cylindrotheca closterium]|uniref:Uncharacterized protein n=1 Tax=Cylindrotheca closterium TaxID=2856 RepID=A0AAD2JM72_9STRA|nr:unnamed protein product [Cylindrotheca closterium]